MLRTRSADLETTKSALQETQLKVGDMVVIGILLHKCPVLGSSRVGLMPKERGSVFVHIDVHSFTRVVSLLPVFQLKTSTSETSELEVQLREKVRTQASPLSSKNV